MTGLMATSKLLHVYHSETRPLAVLAILGFSQNLPETLPISPRAKRTGIVAPFSKVTLVTVSFVGTGDTPGLLDGELPTMTPMSVSTQPIERQLRPNQTFR